ncbi:MAG: hypothetical protein WBF09_00635, partial [Candidatus Acidiferrum sp.]
LGQDLAYFFSGDYLSACDLSTALSRLIPSVIRGEVKPKLARTVAYLMQTLLQTIHVSQDEYINAFSTDGWRKAVRTSVKTNHDHFFPPTPEPEKSTPQPPAPAQPTQPPAATPPHGPSPQPSQSPAPPPTSTSPVEAALAVASSIFPPRPNSTTAQPPASPAPPPPPSASGACHPERSEGSCLHPASPTTDDTNLASPLSPSPASQTNNATPVATPPTPPRPQQRPAAPHRDPYAVHYDHNYHLTVDGKPF